MSHIWSFFESSHGKGEHDGVGACVKRALVKEQVKILGVDLLDAHSIVDWCISTSSQGGTLDSIVHRFFWFVEEGSIGDKSVVLLLETHKKCIHSRDLTLVHGPFGHAS